MPHVKREKNNIKFRFILSALLLVAGIFVINNSSLATGLQVGYSALTLGAAENLYYGNISASSATTSNLLLLQNASVSKFAVDYYGNLTTPGLISAGSFSGPMSGTLNAKNVSSGSFGSSTGGGDYYFPANVGIGTTNPGEKLEINGNLKLRSADASAGNTQGQITFQDNSGYYTGYIKNIITGPSYGYQSALAFFTQNSPYQDAAYERMRIDYTGNVGIGTTNPEFKLDVNGDIAFPRTSKLMFAGPTPGDRSRSYFTGDGNNDVFLYGPSSNLIATFGYTGNVGIGTTGSNDTFSIGSGGAAAPAGSSNTGHNNTATYLSTDNYALVNVGYAKSMIAAATSSLVLGGSNFWGGTKNANIWNGDAGAGNVGIGTTAPGNKLEIHKAYAGSGLIEGPDLGFTTDNGSQTWYTGQISGYIAAGVNNSTGNYPGGLAFKTKAADGAPGTAPATRMLIDAAGNVGIGLTNPSYPLDVSFVNNAARFGSSGGNNNVYVWNSGSGLDLWVGGGNVSSGIAATGNLGFFTNQTLPLTGGTASSPIMTINGSNVGIGTTNPVAKLQSSGAAQIELPVLGNMNGVGFFVSNSDLGYGLMAGVGPSGNSWLQAMRTSSATAYNLNLQPSGGNVGIGLTNPVYKLDVNGTAHFSNWAYGLTPGSSDTAALTTVEYVNAAISGSYGTAVGYWSKNGNDIYKNNSGNVGIGTTAPNDALSIGSGGVAAPAGSSATGHNNTATYLSTDNYALANVGYVKSAITAINSFLPLVGGTMLGDINLNNHNVSGINQLGVAKINATTIDPLYNINNINYATFASSISGGVKEEYVGKADIKRLNANHEYEYIINFALEDEGSDLWVWRKVIDYSNDNVQVFITPSGKFANVYYVIEGNKLIFRSDKAVEISYRLIGKRFDWKLWPTKAIDQTEKGYLVP